MSRQSSRSPERDRHLRYCAHVVGVGPATRDTLAAVLSGFGGRGQPANPSQETLAKWLQRSVRTIQRWTKQLKELGLLNVRRPKPKRDPYSGQWVRNCNRYFPRFRNEKRSERPDKSRSHRGDTSVASTPPEGSLTETAPVGGVENPSERADPAVANAAIAEIRRNLARQHKEVHR